MPDLSAPAPVRPMGSPGVTFPPPLCFAVPWFLGYILHRYHPLPCVPHALAGLMRPLALSLCALALSGLAWAMTRFVLARTSLLPHRPAKAFVVSGPYRFTRNPMYLSLATLHLGTAFLVDSWWLVVGVPVGMILVQRLVIRREERYLAERFGDAYRTYCERVRRWL